MLMELLFCQEEIIFVAGRFINDDEFGKMFVAHIALEHAFKKTNKNVTKQLMSNSVLAQIFLTLWILNPGAASSCSAVWITCMQFVHFWEHNILQFIY